MPAKLSILVPSSTCLLLCLSGWAGSAFAADLRPFVLPWDDGATGPTDISFLNHRPAGKFGPIRVGTNGHLYAGDNRIRFFGVNAVARAAFPKKEMVGKIAARMAKFGINAVRFHHLENTWSRDNIFKKPGTRNLNPEALDRLDYFIAQLKTNGIYSDINLLTSRRFEQADGLPAEIEQVDWKTQHTIGMFNRPLINLQKEYARALLTHTNRYTGLTYAEDPAVAFIEINNENGLMHTWYDGRLDTLPPLYEKELQTKWDKWLARRYKSTKELKSAWKERSDPLGPELLKNAAFNMGAQHWTLERHACAAAEIAIVRATAATNAPRVARITVIKPGWSGWHVQFNQDRLKVNKGHLYTLSFRVKASRKCGMDVSLSQGHAPWQSIGLQRRITVGPEWRSCTFACFAETDDADARIDFTNMGGQTGTYWLSDISFREGGSLRLRKGEGLEKANIPLLNTTAGRDWPEGAREDFVRFLWETERAYWREMYSFIKKDLNARALVFGTIIANSPPNIQAEMDVIDNHAYWCHPQFPDRSWDSEVWRVENKSMANSLPHPLVGIAGMSVVGKPNFVTEYQHAAPNTFSSEAPLMLAAFAAFQDWDGVFLFDYGDDLKPGMFGGFFEVSQHPTKMANVAAASLMFRRGDVQPARERIAVPLDAEREIQTVASRGRPWRVINTEMLGVKREVALLHRLGFDVGASAGKAPQVPDLTNARRFVSDTREIVWDIGPEGGTQGVFTVNAPKTKAIAGFIAGRDFDLGGVKITPGRALQDWCTIAMTLLEGDSFATNCRALVVATGYIENTGMKWKNEDKSSVGRNWGKAPTRVEVIPAEIELPVPAKSVTAWALDERGRRTGRVKVVGRDGRAVVHIGPPHKTIWYEISISL